MEQIEKESHVATRRVMGRSAMRAPSALAQSLARSRARGELTPANGVFAR
jgi:hypothetical protein